MANQLVQLKNGSDNLYPIMKTQLVALNTSALPSGITDNGSMLIVNGNVVFLWLNLDCRNISGSQAQAIGLIPTGYRPMTRLSANMTDGGIGGNTTIGVGTDGNLTIYPGSTGYAQGIVGWAVTS